MLSRPNRTSLSEYIVLRAIMKVYVGGMQRNHLPDGGWKQLTGLPEYIEN